jgi:hypothetical protein
LLPSRFHEQFEAFYAASEIGFEIKFQQYGDIDIYYFFLNDATISDQGIRVLKTACYIVLGMNAVISKILCISRNKNKRKILVSLNEAAGIEALMLRENKMKKRPEYLHLFHVS